MTRTTDDILDELSDLAVGWLSDAPWGELILRALAETLSGVEETWTNWREQLFRQSASEPWLEQWGEEFGVERLPWESVDEYREWVHLGPRSPTPEYIVAQLERRIPGEGHQVDLIEPNRRYTFSSSSDGDRANRGIYSDTTTSILADGTPDRLFVVVLPVPEEIRLPLGCFTDQRSTENVGPYAGATSYLDSGDPWFERRRYRIHALAFLEKCHPASAAYAVLIDDNPDLSTFIPLFNA